MQSLKEEVEVLKVERERVSSSMKDIIHGAEGYKVLRAPLPNYTQPSHALTFPNEQKSMALSSLYG